jgi:hypothetical protein
MSVNVGKLKYNAKSVFYRLQKDTNRESAYWMNQSIDIVPFVENRGYVKKHGTERWPRYEKGSEVFLITDGNTLYHPKTGKNTNLYDFIREHYPKLNPNTGNTKHMVDTVMQHEGLQTFVKPVADPAREHRQTPVNKGAKEFSLHHYRIEKLNPHKNYLLTRGITVETLKHPLFADSVVQGNKTTVDTRYNNVIYPFKSHPSHGNDQMLTLLQQYGKKVEFDGKPIDKVFAEGVGKSRSLWFSNVPEKADRIYVFENPLDALSHYQKYRSDNAFYCATGGNPAQGQYEKITEVCRDLKIRPVLCFDNDFAGCRFDTSYLASVRPDKLSVEKVGEDFYHVKLSDLTESETVNAEAVFNAKDIRIVSKEGNGIVAVIDGTEKSRTFNNFVNTCIAKTDAKIEKSVMKDFNDDLVNNLSKQYASMVNQKKMSF